MDDSGENPVDHFNKQRRNILVICLVVLFYSIGELRFTEFNVFGNKVSLGKPEIVGLSLYIFFTYFVWRFFTASNSVHGMAQVRKAWEVRIDQDAYRFIINRFSQKTKLWRHEFSFTKDTILDEFNELLRHHSYHLSSVKADIQDDQRKEVEKLSASEVKGWKLGTLTLTCVVKSIVCDRPFSEYALPYLLIFITACEIFNIGLVTIILRAMHIVQ